jgi:hypothetical protein
MSPPRAAIRFRSILRVACLGLAAALLSGCIVEVPAHPWHPHPAYDW